MPLDGQALDTTKYKRLVDYLGFSTLPDVNGRYFRAERTPNIKDGQGLPNITGAFRMRPTTGDNVGLVPYIERNIIKKWVVFPSTQTWEMPTV